MIRICVIWIASEIGRLSFLGISSQRRAVFFVAAIIDSAIIMKP